MNYRLPATLTTQGIITGFTGLSSDYGNDVMKTETTVTLPEQNSDVSTSLDIMQFDQLAKYIGLLGVKRIRLFMSYDANWDANQAKVYSSISLQSMIKFVIGFTSFLSVPSVFYNEEGEFSLLWEDQDGLEIDVNFGEQQITVSKESDESEKTLAVEQLMQLNTYLS